MVETKEYLKHGVLFQQPFKEIPSGTLLTVARRQWKKTKGDVTFVAQSPPKSLLSGERLGAGPTFKQRM